MVRLASAFAERGHRVDLVLGRGQGHFLDEIPDAVRLVNLGGRSAFGVVPALLADPSSARRFAPALLSANPPWVLGRVPALEHYLRRERPDAMLSGLNYSNLAALWARKLAGGSTRLVVSEHNTLSVQVANDPRRRERALPKLVRHFYPWADALVAVSEGVADDLAQVSGFERARVRVIYNPVVAPEIEKLAREPAPHPWFEPDAPPVVLGAGKLKPQKDFPTLLRAFARVRAVRSIRLVVLGQGPERRRLETLARELGVERDVALLGFVKNPFAFMARSSAFVLSSAWEGLANVVIEAMACGCPVVSTDCPSGPAEILERGRYGPLVRVGDDAALARAIERTLDTPTPPDRLRARAADFSVDRSADEYLRVLSADRTR